MHTNNSFNFFKIRDFIYIRKKYISVFVLIFLATVITQFIIQIFISKQMQNSRVINLAGRQRMLSQRISRLTLLISRDGATINLVKKLELVNNDFLTGHQSLRDGAPNLGISKPFNDQIYDLYKELDVYVYSIFESTNCIIYNCKDKDKQLNSVIQNTEIFLEKMDHLVFVSDDYSKSQVLFLSRLEYALFFFISIILFFELFGVLLPFQKKILSLFDEQIKSEREKQKLYHLAELGEISSGVVHEIKNFLSIVQGLLDILYRATLKKAEPGEITKYLDMMQNYFLKIDDICKGMSKVSSIDQEAVFSVSEIESDVMDIFEMKFHDLGISFESDCQTKVKIKSNKTQIMQIIFNLIRNSIHAVEKVKDKVLKFEIIEDDHYIYFYLSDSGLGIDEENRNKIMEPFFTTKEKGLGVGIGLSLSRKIAQKLGGNLELVNRSLTTTFLLKIAKNLEEAEASNLQLEET